jgi:hypothetical protein
VGVTYLPQALSAKIRRYVFLNQDRYLDWRLLETTKALFAETRTSASHSQVQEIRQVIQTQKPESSLDDLTIINSFFTAVAPTAVLFSQLVAQIVDFYIEDGRQRERQEFFNLCKSANGDRASLLKFMGCVRNVLGMSPRFYA